MAVRGGRAVAQSARAATVACLLSEAGRENCVGPSVRDRNRAGKAGWESFRERAACRSRACRRGAAPVCWGAGFGRPIRQRAGRLAEAVQPEAKAASLPPLRLEAERQV